MKKEEIISIAPDFQKLIDLVIYHNSSNEFENWYQVWHLVKKMNNELRICGYHSIIPDLANSKSYDDMHNILMNLSTLQ